MSPHWYGCDVELWSFQLRTVHILLVSYVQWHHLAVRMVKTGNMCADTPLRVPLGYRLDRAERSRHAACIMSEPQWTKLFSHKDRW